MAIEKEFPNPTDALFSGMSFESVTQGLDGGDSQQVDDK
jgi:hypothetical protein